MFRSLMPLTALFVSDALVLSGHGLLLTLLPVTASRIGFTDVQVGLTGTAYFVGFIVGCLFTPLVLKRVGHIRSFAVLASLYTATILMFAWLQSFAGWMLLRFMIGSVIAGIYMIIESWLNERADHKNRGTVLAFYSMLNLVMITISQQLLNLSSVTPLMLFALAGILMSLAIIPVSVTLALAPSPINKVTVDIAKVWRHSHIGLIGACFSGLIGGAFWTLAPIYANDSGFNTFQLANFMSAIVLGGALFQLPLGRISDYFDRRLILVYTAAVGALVSLLIFMFSYTDYYIGLLATVSAFFWGGVSMTLYSICLAHANDNADSADFVDIGSAMLISYGVASAIGAPFASIVMGQFGHRFFFIFMAVMFALFCLILVIRRQTHVLPVTDEHEAFHAVAGLTTPVAYNMDPRAELQVEAASDAEMEREISDIADDQQPDWAEEINHAETNQPEAKASGKKD